MSDIQILLAVYNGAAYLDALLASLRNQDAGGFTVLVRDDGSDDGSLDIVRRWQKDWPDRIDILPTGEPARSASGNFGILLKASRARHILFADQDDVWHPTKVRRTVEALETAEREVGVGVPVLAFCDLRLVAADLTLLHPSMRTFQRMEVTAGIGFPRLLMDNVVTGCAAGINAALRDRAVPVPAAAMMHDWWLALVAAAFGRIVTLPEALIDYRQHGGNAVGAEAWSLSRALASRLSPRALRAKRAGFAAFLNRRLEQAAAFQARYGDALDPRDREILTAFLGLPKAGFIERRLRLYRHGFGLPGRRNLALLFQL